MNRRRHIHCNWQTFSRYRFGNNCKYEHSQKKIVIDFESINHLPFFTPAEVVATGVVELEAVVVTEVVDIDWAADELLTCTKLPWTSNIILFPRTCGDLVWTSLALVCNTREVGIGAIRTGDVWPNFCFCNWLDGETNLTNCNCKDTNRIRDYWKEEKLTNIYRYPSLNMVLV